MTWRLGNAAMGVPVALAALAVLVRILVLAAGLQAPQVWEYHYIARDLAAGGAFKIDVNGAWYRTFIDVPYIFVCAALYAIFGVSATAVVVFQWLASVGTTLAAYALARRLFGSFAGLLAGVLVALHPGLVYYDVRNLHPVGFAAALVSLSVLALLRLRARPALGTAAVAGLLHGLAVFERGTFIGLPALTVGALIVRPTLIRPLVLAVYVAAAAAVVAPWLIRSTVIYGVPVMTTTDAETLWRGNNPRSDGGGYDRDRPDATVLSTAPRDFHGAVMAADELGQRRLFATAAREFIVQQPGEAARLFGWKLRGFWWFMPHSGAWYPATYTRAYAIYYSVLLALGIAGVVASFRAAAWSEARLVLIFLVAVTLIQAVFVVEIRHRWAVEALLIVFSAGGLAAVGRVLRRRLVAVDAGC